MCFTTKNFRTWNANLELIKESARSNKELIISTGMSTLEEVDNAVQTIKNANSNCQYSILHCNSSYPAPVEDLNLKCIKTLQERYQCRVGYSGHESILLPSILAANMGAVIIERHITLDRTMWGTDQLSSVEPQGLIKLVKGIRELEESFGDGKIIVTESEKPVRKKLRP